MIAFCCCGCRNCGSDYGCGCCSDARIDGNDHDHGLDHDRGFDLALALALCSGIDLDHDHDLDRAWCALATLEVPRVDHWDPHHHPKMEQTPSHHDRDYRDCDHNTPSVVHHEDDVVVVMDHHHEGEAWDHHRDDLHHVEATSRDLRLHHHMDHAVDNLHFLPSHIAALHHDHVHVHDRVHDDDNCNSAVGTHIYDNAHCRHPSPWAVARCYCYQQVAMAVVCYCCCYCCHYLAYYYCPDSVVVLVLVQPLPSHPAPCSHQPHYSWPP
mmetsp:Transcript_7055/g.10548  ORF Transcript_7055/g.10548 Transcript_7055/m.10548 type:complete len:268 (-) Transcript_7055:2760-3563(-)